MFDITIVIVWAIFSNRIFYIHLFLCGWLCQQLVVARGLSSCGFNCPVACGILVPQPGIECVSPALEGRFLTSGPHKRSPQGF